MKASSPPKDTDRVLSSFNSTLMSSPVRVYVSSLASGRDWKTTLSFS